MCHKAITPVRRSGLLDSNVCTIDSMAEPLQFVQQIRPLLVKCMPGHQQCLCWMEKKKSYSTTRRHESAYVMTRDDCIHLVQMDR
jgi:hypothetical protein